MLQLTQVHDPYCGGTMVWNQKKQAFVCEKCGGLEKVQDIMSKFVNDKVRVEDRNVRPTAI